MRTGHGGSFSGRLSSPHSAKVATPKIAATMNAETHFMGKEFTRWLRSLLSPGCARRWHPVSVDAAVFPACRACLRKRSWAYKQWIRLIIHLEAAQSTTKAPCSRAVVLD